MTNTENFEALSKEDQDKVMQAVNILCTEPGIADKLTKLAEIKTTKPFIWKMALKKLGV